MFFPTTFSGQRFTPQATHLCPKVHPLFLTSHFPIFFLSRSTGSILGRFAPRTDSFFFHRFFSPFPRFSAPPKDGLSRKTLFFDWLSADHHFQRAFFWDSSPYLMVTGMSKKAPFCPPVPSQPRSSLFFFEISPIFVCQSPPQLTPERPPHNPSGLPSSFFVHFPRDHSFPQRILSPQYAKKLHIDSPP